LRYLARRYGADPVFNSFGRPVVVVTGSSTFPVSALRAAIAPVSTSLRVLSSAKNVADYRGTSSFTEGNAYYWSSAHPSRPAYTKKLQEFGTEVHRQGGLWFAPAAAGFDGRLTGGHQVVQPDGGATLRTAVRVAEQSHPDALAIISWNEFSEASYIEPSEKNGDRLLAALSDLLGGKVRLPSALVNARPREARSGLTSVGALGAIVLTGFLVTIAGRSRRRHGRAGRSRV
jgi:hypothetical protein